VRGDVDFPNREHHVGSFARTLSAFGVNRLTSVLNFNKGRWSCITVLSTLSAEGIVFTDQKRVSSNFLGDSFPPEN
jgi:hypothetical protein